MTDHTPAGAALTDLILETFRLNGRLIAAGDRLVKPLGLTSARWQVLGAAAMAERPGPVPAIARAMGLTRQGVQRVVDELVAAGLLQMLPNPDHKRARLVVLTDAGRETFKAASKIQAPWADALAEGLSPEVLQAATASLRRLRATIEGDQARGSVPTRT